MIWSGNRAQGDGKKKLAKQRCLRNSFARSLEGSEKQAMSSSARVTGIEEEQRTGRT
jgi:hypothetical protein